MRATTLTAQRDFTTRRKITINWWGVVSTGLYGSLTILCTAVAVDAFIVGGLWGILLGIMYLSCAGIFVMLLSEAWSWS